MSIGSNTADSGDARRRSTEKPRSSSPSVYARLQEFDRDVAAICVELSDPRNAVITEVSTDSVLGKHYTCKLPGTPKPLPLIYWQDLLRPAELVMKGTGLGYAQDFPAAFLKLREQEKPLFFY